MEVAARAPARSLEVVGPSLTLRYATAADAPALLTLGADSEVTQFFSWGPYTSLERPVHTSRP